MSSAKIDDAKPAHADPAAAVDVETFVIRPAVAYQVAHGVHIGNLRLAIPEEKSRYPAHGIRNATISSDVLATNLPNDTPAARLRTLLHSCYSTRTLVIHFFRSHKVLCDNQKLH